WAGAVFFDWVPSDWLRRDNDTVFKGYMKSFEQKRSWLHKTVSKHFGGETLQLLCSTRSGTILDASTVLTSIERIQEFNLVSRLGALELNKENTLGQDN